MQIYPLFFMRFFIIFKKETMIVCGLLSILLLIIGLLFIGICWRYLNMNNYKYLENVLFQNIKNLFDVCSIFCVNPDTDFTRNRMLDFETTMKIVLCMGASPIKDELLKFNDFSIATPSASAFVQARSKIKPEAFKALFNGFWYYVKKKCHWTSMHCMPKKENWYSRKSMHVCLCIISVKGLYRK